MTTKDYCLPNKPNFIIGETSNGQYSNLNLNHNHQILTPFTVASKSVTNDNGKYQKYGSIGCSLFLKTFFNEVNEAIF